MQPRRAALQQAFAHVRYHVQRKGADGFGIVGVGIQFEPQPARDFRAAHIGKAHQLGKAVHGDDAGDDGDRPQSENKHRR